MKIISAWKGCSATTGEVEAAGGVGVTAGSESEARATLGGLGCDQGRSGLNPYKPYLLQQYNQGRRQVKVLFHEVQKQGYKGSYMTVTRYVRQLAQVQRVTLRPYPVRRRLPPVTTY